MRQPMNEEYDREDYVATVETVEGFVFIHLTVHNWSKSTLYSIRELLEQFLDKADKKGHAAVFMASDDKKSVKMWQMVKPCFQVVEERKNGRTFYLGSWITGE